MKRLIRKLLDARPTRRSSAPTVLSALLEHLEKKELLTNYFVDANNGSDDNSGTSPEDAWRSYNPIVSAYGQTDPNIGKVTLQAGDRVTFAPGLYSSTHRNPSEAPYHGFALRGISGTENAPIIISAEPGAVFDAQPPGDVGGFTVDLENVSHVVVQGLTFTGFGTAINLGGSNNVTIRDSWFYDIDGTASANIEGIRVSGGSENVIEGNWFADIYDRRAANANSRAIVLFQPGSTMIVNNTIENTPDTDAAVTGAGISVKHAGPGPVVMRGNKVVRAYSHSLATGSADTDISHNLVIDSASISVVNGGGITHIRDIDIRNNTVVSRNRGDLQADGTSSGAALFGYAPDDTYSQIGTVTLTNNITTDDRSYNVDRSTVDVGRYSTDHYYQQVIGRQTLQVDDNVYHHESDALAFNLFNGGTIPQGGQFSFTEWRNRGYDTNSIVANPELDDVFFPMNVDVQQRGVGWYARTALTVMPVGDTRINEGQQTRYAVVRSGTSFDRPLTVELSASDSTEIQFPQTVTIPPGSHKAYFDILAVSDGETDGSRAVQLTATAAGFDDTAPHWVRIDDDGSTTERTVQVARELGLERSDREYFNWGGRQEKWIRGTAGWYFILPDGGLYRWDGSQPGSLTGILVEQFDFVYEDLSEFFPDTAGGASELRDLDHEYQFSEQPNYWRNWGGQNEKWLRAASGTWFYVTPAGDLTQWDSSSGRELRGTVIATMNPIVYQDLSLLYEAEAIATDEALGLVGTGNLHHDWGGLGEKWFKGNTGWYYIIPDGDLFRWDSSSGRDLQGEHYASLGSAYHQDPSRLYDALDGVFDDWRMLF